MTIADLLRELLHLTAELPMLQNIELVVILPDGERASVETVRLEPDVDEFVLTLEEYDEVNQ